jgi:hypothetical protein
MKLPSSSDTFKRLYIKMRSMPPKIRTDLARAPAAEHWLSLLTPTQLANLFPHYYKRGLPDVGLTRAASGGVTFAGRTPLMSAATAAPYGGGGGEGGGGGFKWPSAGTAEPLPPDPNDEMKKLLEKEGVSLPTSAETFTTLKDQRVKLLEELDANPALKSTWAAMAISEVGADADEKSLRQIMETMANRAVAQGRTLDDIFKRYPPHDTRNYWGPYNDGAFDRNMEYLRKNPDAFAALNKRIDEVIQGSNDSNLATDNSSADVAANARITQTITGETKTKETLSRKDKPEYAYLHGPPVTKRNQEWAARSQAGIDQEKELAKQRENAENIPPQDASQTGSMEEEGLKGKPKPGETAVIADPEGMTDQTKKFWDTLTPPQKEAFKKGIEKIGGIEKVNELAKQAHKTASGVPELNLEGLPIPQVGPMGPKNRFSRQGNPTPNPKLKPVKTAYGNIQVDESSAIAFQGFLGDLKKEGAPLKRPGSYNPRKKRRGSTWSEHAHGNAIDFNDERYFSKDFQAWKDRNPEKYEKAKEKWGILQPYPGTQPGSYKDPAHHEFTGKISQEAYDEIKALQKEREDELTKMKTKAAPVIVQDRNQTGSMKEEPLAGKPEVTPTPAATPTPATPVPATTPAPQPEPAPPTGEVKPAQTQSPPPQAPIPAPTPAPVPTPPGPQSEKKPEAQSVPQKTSVHATPLPAKSGVMVDATTHQAQTKSVERALEPSGKIAGHPDKHNAGSAVV